MTAPTRWRGGEDVRRLKRNILRLRAEALGVKPSAYVNKMWDRYQRRLRGAGRAINQARGTRPKRKWSA